MYLLLCKNIESYIKLDFSDSIYIDPKEAADDANDLRNNKREGKKKDASI